MDNNKKWACRPVLSAIFVFASVVAALADSSLALGDRAAGWAFNKRSAAQAENDALIGCGRYGTNCTTRLTFRGYCIAIAHAKLKDGRSGFIWSLQNSPGRAQDAVFAKCRQFDGLCQVRKVECDGYFPQASRVTNGPTQQTNTTPPNSTPPNTTPPNRTGQVTPTPVPAPPPPVPQPQPPNQSEACKEFPNLC